jgi:hypothetical protein
MLIGGTRVREMSDQLTGKLVNVDASQVVELVSLEVEDSRSTDNRDVNATAVEDLSVHHFPFAFRRAPIHPITLQGLNVPAAAFFRAAKPQLLLVRAFAR